MSETNETRHDGTATSHSYARPIRIKLSWSEELTPAQLQRLVSLSRRISTARAALFQAEREYRDELEAVAEPFIQSKLAGLALRDVGRLDRGIAMGNQFSANPQPRLDITVSNEPDHHTMPVMDVRA